MSTVLQRIVREPNAILGVVTAAVNLLVLFGLNLSAEQIAGINVLLGALIIAARQLVTPAAEVVAQQKPGKPVVAGPAARPGSTVVHMLNEDAHPTDPPLDADAGQGY